MKHEGKLWAAVAVVLLFGVLLNGCYLFQPAFSSDTRTMVIESLENRRRELAAAYSDGQITTDEYERELARIGATLQDLSEDSSRGDWGNIAVEVGGLLAGTTTLAAVIAGRARKKAVAEIESKPSRAATDLAEAEVRIARLEARMHERSAT